MIFSYKGYLSFVPLRSKSRVSRKICVQQHCLSQLQAVTFSFLFERQFFHTNSSRNFLLQLFDFPYGLQSALYMLSYPEYHLHKGQHSRLHHVYMQHKNLQASLFFETKKNSLRALRRPLQTQCRTHALHILSVRKNGFVPVRLYCSPPPFIFIVVLFKSEYSNRSVNFPFLNTACRRTPS